MSSTYLDAGGASLPDNIFDEEMNQEEDTSYGNELGQGADVVLTHVKAGDVNLNGKAGGCDEFLYD
jgi:hypothetical protein